MCVCVCVRARARADRCVYRYVQVYMGDNVCREITGVHICSYTYICTHYVHLNMWCAGCVYDELFIHMCSIVYVYTGYLHGHVLLCWNISHLHLCIPVYMYTYVSTSVYFQGLCISVYIC